MPSARTILTASLLLPLAMASGCTVYSAPGHATLQTTTSAEQTERLFWQAAVKQDFATVSQLIAAGAVFAMRDGSVLTREQFVEQMRAAPPVDYSIGQVTVRPQGNDMVLTYPASVRGTGAATASVTILSVWRQTKNSMWTLIARSETPTAIPVK